MAGVLEGIRVLDWTQFQSGPVCSMLLGDLGADVIKIEERIGGDRARGVFAVAGKAVVDSLEGRNPYFEIGNRNKRSITIDFTKERGRKIVYELVAKSDVFVHNFRMSTVQMLGMDYETLLRYNSRLIYGQTSGWGPKGPNSGAPGFDPAALAKSGFWSLITEPGRAPQYPQGGVADQMGGIMAAFGILAALFHRDRTGRGQRVDASILGGMTFLVGYPLGIYAMCGFPPMFVDRASPWNPLFNQYECGDGKWIALVLIPPDRYWTNFCSAMGLEELEKNPRFATMESRQQNSRELITILDERFAARSSQEWEEILSEHGMVFSVVSTIEEYVNDPQALANEYITEYNHPVWGPLKSMGFPVGLSETPCKIQREAPEFGQHTEEVLMEVLGYKWDDISNFKDEELI